MISFSPCKINIGLHVFSKRPDGYHGIETCFYPIPWTDILEIIPSSVLEFSSSGTPIPGKREENLCLRAYQLLKITFDLQPVKIHVHKIIPTGAGLGGGSSNAAYTLRLLNTLFNLQLTIDQLRRYGSQLGSDCSFFMGDEPMIGTGRGEIIKETQVSLRGKFAVIIKPDIHVSTAAAYADIRPATKIRSVQDIIEKADFKEWKSLLKNDFEDSIFKKYPMISEIKSKLYQHGAVYASMSGSGSAVYGIFNEPVDLNNHFQNVVYWSGVLD